VIIPQIRSDKLGSGEYLAPRGGRRHKGVDFECKAGQPFFSDVSGKVLRLGYPYSKNGIKGQYRLIEIKVDSQTKAKYMYLSPLSDIKPNVSIERGECIGYVQDLTSIYPGITNHVHFEIWVEGDHVNPVNWLKWRGYA
jgi:murein DD-endopeptidase MepM/ murein hydrolase activator NlpD